jgi:antitoxin component YwqK of YwqJK toxin-antitoxin module
MKSYWIYIIFIFVLCACGENASTESNKINSDTNVEDEADAKSGLYKTGLIDTIDYQYQEWYPGRNQLKIGGMFDEQYKRHGKWVFYDKNGIELSMTTYTHNLKQGFSIVKYPNGVIYYRGEYNQDKKVGLWTFYNDKGEKDKEIIYNSNGEIVNETNYDTE